MVELTSNKINKREIAAVRGIRKSRDRKWFDLIGYTVVSLIALTCLIPFLLVVSGSFTAEESIYRDGYRLIPASFSLESYQFIFRASEQVFRAYAVTVGLVIAGTACGLLLTAMTAYALSRKDFKFRNFFAYGFFFTTLFSGGLVPWYILMVDYLHMKNNWLALLLPQLLNVFYIIVMRTFFHSIPDAVGESAKVDGAGDFTIFTRIILPMAVPSLATIGLFTALQYWNDWFNAMLFMTDERRFPLQYFLYKVLNTMSYASEVSQKTGIPVPEMPKESFKLAMTVVATGPIIFLYPFVQKYFIKGLTIGAVKG